MSHSPRVTIAIPVYNGAKYLAEAIESALSQTYPHTEIFVVNDGSTDRGATEAVAARYSGRINYIKQENKGVGGAMNTVLRCMTGDFFSWLSHDDIWLPHKLSSQLSFYRKLNKSDAIIFSNYYQIDENGAILRELNLQFDRYVKSPMLPLLNAELNGCTLLIPSRILKQFGPFDENLRFVQDYDLWNRILKKHDFFLQTESLVKYRIHPGQATRRPEMAAEGDALWTRMVDDRTVSERVQLCGSSKAFYVHMAERLERSPYKKAAAHAWALSRTAAEDTLVSVIVYSCGQEGFFAASLESVLRQSHPRLDIVLIGTPTTLSKVAATGAADSRIRQVLREDEDPAAARNAGLQAARGEYIAFLEAGSEFMPDKIATQLSAMLDSGSLISHTSIGIEKRAAREFALVKAGEISGIWFAKAISEFPSLRSTLMVHRSLVDAGAETESSNGVSDIAHWAHLGANTDIKGIPQSLTVVRHAPELNSLNVRTRSLEKLRRVLRKEAAFVFDGRANKKKRAQERAYRKEARSLAKELFDSGQIKAGIAVLRSAISKPEEQRLAIAMSRANAGSASDAIPCYRNYLAGRPDDGRRWYALASCLAVDGNLAEADAIFRRNIQFALKNGTLTNTEIIRLTDAPKGSDGLARSSFLKRRKVMIDAHSAELLADVDFVYFVSCDSKYLIKYLWPFLRSLEENAGILCGVHLHIINCSDAAASEIERIQNTLSLPIAVSHEAFNADELAEEGLTTYYSLARFLVLPELLRLYNKSILVADVDQLVMGDLSSLTDKLQSYDVGLLYFPSNVDNIMSIVSATVLMARPSGPGFDYVNLVKCYLIRRINELDERLFWHLDQVALAVALLKSPRLRWYQIPTSLLRSAAWCDGNFADSDSLFFSVTASIPRTRRNSRALVWPARC